MGAPKAALSVEPFRCFCAIAVALAAFAVDGQ